MPRSPDAEPKPTLFVLYGATGDLCKRMVLPAFFQLWQKGLMPKEWKLIGNGRGDVAHEDFRKHFHDALVEFSTRPKPADWAKFKQRLYFAGGGFNTSDPGSLLEVIAQQRKQRAQLIHYFAVPPNAFIELTKALEAHGLAKGARVVYEKPYGTSPEGFAELDEEVHKVLPDHPSSCEEGYCGECETRVLEGTPDHQDDYLTEDEQENGDMMMICVGRCKGTRLVLDL